VTGNPKVSQDIFGLFAPFYLREVIGNSETRLNCKNISCTMGVGSNQIIFYGRGIQGYFV